MSFITGLILIDAPASALNNLGNMPGSMTENVVGVKFIPTREGNYPYVSAQAFRYWLRTTLEQGNWGWKAAPIFREAKIAYTDANPILYWDDDLFGYMRAPSKKTEAANARETSGLVAEATPTAETVTRISPFRVSTLVSVAPVRLVEDFGTMSRHEGDPVPHGHQFYRAALQGLFSLDLHAVGTFTYIQRTGYLNLDEERCKLAVEKKLEHLEKEKAYRLPLKERVTRVRALLEGLAELSGGAKQTLHYTDVSPDILVLAVTRGGNHVFGHIIGAQGERPVLNLPALREALDVNREGLLSDVYVGWVRGYLDAEREKLETALGEGGVLSDWNGRIHLIHPREACQRLAQELEAHPDWMQ
ncbi:type I-B CRISPR-associated protein Cas7/Cst2/DevR [Thermanaerothrix sp.]|jgi:CRISPR-associated protein Cst2|uniref:type I-B CRISPR-associated protein Cas7/Cst2/DevR n=1 Tax=Thermanaerothrix sp. TaxID=2972675 RepID=UPI002ADE7E14|nr:type I-B CRISPR-associated protein Cas7/Cst2/DevR [Thermanaerothrix sp.]